MSAKKKTVFFCKECGFENAKWTGRCPNCGQWNTFVEELVVTGTKAPTGWGGSKGEKVQPRNIKDIQGGEHQRLPMPDKELNRVLGGGLVPGAVTLLGGEPGIGKSTLLLQLALKIKAKVAYVSGEESDEQIKLRAERIGIQNDECLVFPETQLEAVLSMLKQEQPAVVVVDSVQTLYSEMVDSAPGSIVQIRECTARLLRFAKTADVPVFLIGHITKDGSIAGPKILEHMVDTVLQFEGDRHHTYRLLRTMKNRFGSTHEIGIYEMQGTGLRQVENPSEILLSQRDEQLSGVAISAALEGARPLMIETQALVSPAVYGTPQRTATGYDLRRLNMLLAVLDKRCGFKLGAHDVFINIAGGIKLEDPALDLALVSAIMSSYQNMPLPEKTVFSGEVGLSGEVRAVNRVEQRIIEAERLGFEEMVISKYNKIPQGKWKISLRLVGKIEEVFEGYWG